uniref:Uncharacterized protein n=1 Tax=Glossina pallidipes TaxID=7398 RepID=A0A1B0A850_GLOPL
MAACCMSSSRRLAILAASNKAGFIVGGSKSVLVLTLDESNCCSGVASSRGVMGCQLTSIGMCHHPTFAAVMFVFYGYRHDKPLEDGDCGEFGAELLSIPDEVEDEDDVTAAFTVELLLLTTFSSSSSGISVRRLATEYHATLFAFKLRFIARDFSNSSCVGLGRWRRTAGICFMRQLELLLSWLTGRIHGYIGRIFSLNIPEMNRNETMLYLPTFAIFLT